MATIDFAAQYLERDAEKPYQWSGLFSVNKGRCESEKLSYGEYLYSYTKQGEKYVIHEPANQGAMSGINPVAFNYEGSFFSIFRPYELRGFEGVVSNCYSLDLLSPQQMRARVRKRDEKGVGIGGEQLGHALLDLTPSEKDELKKVMRR